MLSSHIIVNQQKFFPSFFHNLNEFKRKQITLAMYSQQLEHHDQ